MNAEEIQALRSELAEVSAAGAWSSPAAVKRWTGWIIEALPRALSALEACQREREHYRTALHAIGYNGLTESDASPVMIYKGLQAIAREALKIAAGAQEPRT